MYKITKTDNPVKIKRYLIKIKHSKKLNLNQINRHNLWKGQK